MSSKLFPYRGESEGLVCPEDTRTQWQFAKDTEISSIMKRYQVTGVLPNIGMACLPADEFFGGVDFAEMQSTISDYVNNPQSQESAAPTNNEPPAEADKTDASDTKLAPTE